MMRFLGQLEGLVKTLAEREIANASKVILKSLRSTIHIQEQDSMTAYRPSSAATGASIKPVFVDPDSAPVIETFRSQQ